MIEVVMLHMILLIIKIIGIALLSLLGLLLLILALVLFVPVRYQLRVTADESGQAALSGKRSRRESSDGPKEDAARNVKVRACVSWLFHILHVRAAFAKEFGMVVRVCGIPIKRIPERDQPIKDEPKEESKQAAAHSSSPPEDTVQADADTAQTDADTESQASDAGTVPDREEGRHKKSVFEKLKKFFRAIAAFFRNIWYTIRNICDKIKEIMQRIDYYLDVLGSDEGRRTIRLLKSQLGALLKHICPTKVCGQFQIGMEDPAAAGQIAAIAGMLYPIFGNHIRIETVFGEKRFSGNLFLKGRVRVITLIRIAWRVYFNKDIKKFLRRLKREEKE